MENQKRILGRMIGDRIKAALLKEYGSAGGTIGEVTMSETETNRGRTNTHISISVDNTTNPFLISLFRSIIYRYTVHENTDMLTVMAANRIQIDIIFVTGDNRTIIINKIVELEEL